jgi:hypothetical protein
MAESPPLPKVCVRSSPEGRPQGQPRRSTSRPALHAICAPRRGRQHIEDQALGLESELSGDMAVVDEELDAIARLLGDALADLLVGS